MYVQIEKHIETYQEIVSRGELPIAKGHALTESETNMRKHILNLMCKDPISWDLISKDAVSITPFLSILDELVEESLIKYSANQIAVTEKGKYFIRNICAVIDPIFQNMTVNSKMFSKAI